MLIFSLTQVRKCRKSDSLNAQAPRKDGGGMKALSACGDNNSRINNEHMKFSVKGDEDGNRKQCQTSGSRSQVRVPDAQVSTVL
jgi:hypothetical protein